MRNYWCFALALAAGVCSSHAQLTWETKEIKLKAAPFAEYVDASFKFTNTGPAAIVIKEVKTSCGCTTAELAKKEYAPGEFGEIKAKFNAGGRKGTQSKSIHVTTDVEKDPITTLMLTTEIPDVVRIEPSAIVWSLNSPATPKSIKISIGIDEPVKVTEVTTISDKFKTELVTISEGKQYEVKVTPTATDAGSKAVFQIKIDKPADKPRMFTAVAYVR